MFKEDFEPLVVKMAYETIEMHEELIGLRAEVEDSISCFKWSFNKFKRLAKATA